MLNNNNTQNIIMKMQGIFKTKTKKVNLLLVLILFLTGNGIFINYDYEEIEENTIILTIYKNIIIFIRHSSYFENLIVIKIYIFLKKNYFKAINFEACM